jgi:hypothetical protein
MMLLMVLSFIASSVSNAINRIPWLMQLKTASAYVALFDPKKKLVPPFIKIAPNDPISPKNIFLSKIVLNPFLLVVDPVDAN